MFPHKIRQKLHEQDFGNDNKSLSCNELIGTAALSGMVIIKIDSPRPDRQDYLDLLIEKFPPVA